ncbi:DUF1631 domain-containing protein [Simiduia sp. 21SJ11W-1]|uniref:DUF1631 family protein n=1 Tax=Simiduia sp. 21SJ11W-1 TaxID=2909669 RepID=UPI00209F2C47|nr:DUF1631 family protein [Simiduia sp. 21SJ11W-1]UTA46946.1 DUF1631 domain-containing protein [Simiduia sp. 21SJ11W-1]
MAGLSTKLLTSGQVEPIKRLFMLAAESANQTPEAYRTALMASLAGALFAPAQLHPELAAVWQPQAVQLAKCAAGDLRFFVSPDHALRQLAQWLHTEACLWHPAEDKASRDFFTSAQALAALTAKRSPKDDELGKAVQEALKVAEKSRQRATLAAERLRENELSNLRIQTAEARVVELLDRHLAHRPMPVQLIPHLNTTLKGELQHLALTQAVYTQQPFWQMWERLLPVLGRCFSGAGMTVGDQLLYQTIPPLLEELEQSLALPMVDATAYESWVNELSHCLMQAIRKDDIECEKLAPLAETLGLPASAARVTQALLAELDGLSPGDWFIFDGEHASAQRCQLVVNDGGVDQLIFVDRNGRKLFAKSKQDFAACLSTGIAQPLVHTAPVTILLDALNASAADAGAQQRKLREAQAKEKAAQQAEAQKQQAARKAAAEKALAEARALDEAKAKKQQARATARALAETAAKHKKHEQAVGLVDAMQVGAWLTFAEGSEHAGKRAKLSVVIAKTGKYIFVDELGRKLAEFDRTGLINLLDSGQATIVRNGNNFDDQLVKVIRGLRRDSV